MTDDDRILISLQARIDRLWEPLRQREWRENRVAAAVHQRRDLFRKGGIEWTSSLLEFDNRMQSLRGMRRLAAAGLVTTTETRGRTDLIQVTDAGEARVRSMCAQPFLRATFSRMLQIMAAEEIDDGHLSWGPMIAEMTLVGFRYNDHDADMDLVLENVNGLIDDVLPGLIRGWIGSYSSIPGHVRYVVHDPSALEGELPEFPVVKSTKGAIDFYMNQYNGCRREMLSWKPTGNDLAIPLPATYPGPDWMGGFLGAAEQGRDFRRQRYERLAARWRDKL